MKKLYLYDRGTEQTIIDGFECKSWNDILLVKISCSYDEFMNMAGDIGIQIQERVPDKKVICFPSDIDIQFYGIQDLSPSLFEWAGADEG